MSQQEDLQQLSQLVEKIAREAIEGIQLRTDEDVSGKSISKETSLAIESLQLNQVVKRAVYRGMMTGLKAVLRGNLSRIAKAVGTNRATIRAWNKLAEITLKKAA